MDRKETIPVQIVFSGTEEKELIKTARKTCIDREVSLSAYIKGLIRADLGPLLPRKNRKDPGAELENIPPLPFDGKPPRATRKDPDVFEDDRLYTVKEIAETRGIMTASVIAGLKKAGIMDHSRTFTGREIKSMGFGRPKRGVKGKGSQ